MRQLRSEQRVHGVDFTDLLDQEMSCVPGGAERDGGRFYHAVQNGVQVTIRELLTSRIFHSTVFQLELALESELGRETTPKKTPLHLSRTRGVANTQASSFVRLL